MWGIVAPPRTDRHIRRVVTMLTASLAEGWRDIILVLAGVALGVPALQANVSSTVGIVPSFFGSVRGFRPHVAAHRDLVRSLVAPSLAGTLAGCALLLTGSPTTFRLIVPWLIGAATILFAVAPLVTKRLAHLEHNHPARRRALWVGVLLTSVYAGYFGAGIGISLLAIMAMALPYDIREIQGLRSALSMVISATAALVFLVRGHLAWDAVGAMLVGTALGGWLGARLITRLPPAAVRAVVVLIGLVTTLRLALSA